MALAAVVKSASSASAAANAIILPLAFVSDVFVELDDAPRWLEVVGDIFPLKPFVRVVPGLLQPDGRCAGVRLGGDGVRGRCGALAGLAVALKRFRWEPSGSAPRGRRARRVATELSARPQENTTVLRP